MSIRKMDKSEINKISGGANQERGQDLDKPLKKYRFRCTICGYTWAMKSHSPENECGCPRCGWWFESLEDNGNWEKQCIKYQELRCK